MIVGSSFSAEDLAMQSIRAGAARVTISYRTCPMNLKFPPNVDEKPLLTQIQGSTVRYGIFFLLRYGNFHHLWLTFSYETDSYGNFLSNKGLAYIVRYGLLLAMALLR